MVLVVRTGQLQARRCHEQRLAGDLVPGPGGPHTKRARLHEVHGVSGRTLAFRVAVDHAGRVVEAPERDRVRMDQLNHAIHRPHVRTFRHVTPPRGPTFRKKPQAASLRPG